MPTMIVKRQVNGKPAHRETWDVRKIAAAISKAMKVCGLEDIIMAKRLAMKVERELELEGKDTPHIEHVQNIVEDVLNKHAPRGVGKRYTLYREQRRQAREGKAAFVDVTATIDSYLDKSDWRVAENANISHSFQGMMLRLSGTIQSRYALEKYPVEIREAHEHGYFHIHDLDMGLAGYCSGWSLRDLLLEGYNLDGYCCSGPPKHMDAVLGQMNNFLGTLQNEWAGAQAFNNVDTLLAPFVRADGLDYEHVKQAMQKFVFNLNTTSRWGGQSPFINLSFDLVPPKHLAKEGVIIGGVMEDSCYGDYVEEMEMINRAFLEVMLHGDYKRQPFSFPIPTYNVTKDFPWDDKVGGLLLDLAGKYGAPYFQNFINSDLDPEDVRSMCCRLKMDLREIRKKVGGLFGAGDLTGSIGVVTLNLPRLAFASTDEEDFLEQVTMFAEMARDQLELKRKMLDINLERGMFPWTRRYLKNGYSGHYSTIGLLGGHEACLNLLGEGIQTSNGQALMARTLEHLVSLCERFAKETGSMYNLEATPAEGTCYRLARLDRTAYGDRIRTSGTNETPYYTNSTNLPVNATDDPVEALMHQNELQPIYTGGTVFHNFLGEAVSSRKALKNHIVRAFSETKIPFLSITPTYSICPEHGYQSGEHELCPHCGQECLVYTRVTGYYRPTKRFNDGKKAEYAQRREYKEPYEGPELVAV